MADLQLTPQQQAVVENRGGTLLVSAAAGSGKTKVLVDRVLRRIVADGKNINEFLIITFTNAAAAELRAKISDAITAELAAQPENRHLARQLNLLQMSQISTVHAFCGALIREYGYLLEIPSDFRVLDDGERQELLDKQLDQLLEDAYERQDPAFLQLTDTLGAGRDDSRLRQYIAMVYEKALSQPDPQRWMRQQQFEIPEDVDLTETTWGRLIMQQAKFRLEGLIARYEWAVSAMQGDELLQKSYLPCYAMQLSSLKNMLENLKLPWDQLADHFQMEYPAVRVSKYPDKEHLKTIQDVKSDGKKLLESIRGLFSRREEDLKREQNAMAPSLRALMELCIELDRRFSQEKRRKNVLDFSDQEHIAIRLLVHRESGRPKDTALEIAARYAEIMVDEYQDSNRVQETIFRAIASGNDENRFLVGDVKQSIYGFRMAEPDMFLEKYRQYPVADQAADGEPRKLILSSNFRSRPEILAAVNHTFRTIMSPTVGGMEYGPEEALYPGLPAYPASGDDQHVELHVLELKKLADDVEEIRNQREARWVANRIVAMLEQPAMIRDGETLRPVRPEDIAILFRARGPMAEFSRVLRNAGLPVAADTEENLLETPEATVLLNLLRVLNNPHQDIPLLAVLCSPLFRFSNEKLAQIRAQSEKKRFYDAMQACREPWCVQALERIQALRKRAGSMPADRLIWELLHETGMLTAYSAMDRGSQRRSNLLAVYQFARDCASGEYLYLYQLLRMLERAAKNGTLTTRNQTAGVLLTTIHKSKGLEYPVVFLPCLSQKFNMQELSRPVLYDGSLGIAAQITDLEHRVRYPGICHQAIKQKRSRDLRSEEIRLLYVAMTRAKDYLIMSYADKNPTGVLSKLKQGAGMPASTWLTSQTDQMGKWVLLAALNRVEAGALFAQCGRPDCQLTVSEYPWGIEYKSLEEVELRSYHAEESLEESWQTILPDPDQMAKMLQWTDAHESAASIPSKLTATQMKGREKDTEAAEGAGVQARLLQLRRPEFVLEKQGLSPTERGTAVHLFLQYADYERCCTIEDVEEEKLRLEDEEFLTAEQLQAVDPARIAAMFSSTFGQRMLHAKKLIREFKFSILTDASAYYPNVDGEQLLLQGVVDAAWVEGDGICVLDFKTDRVTDATIPERTEYYREQLLTYKNALERIFDMPVKAMYLYFLAVGKEVLL